MGHEIMLMLRKLGTPIAGMLSALWAIRFECNKPLDEKQKKSACACLDAIAEDVNNPPELRSWCYNQLGNIFSGRSNFISLK